MPRRLRQRLPTPQNDSGAVPNTTFGASRGGMPRFVYNEDTARKLASLAEASYCGPMPAMSDWSCLPCQESGITIAPSTWRGVHGKQFGDDHHTFVSLARIDGPAEFSDSCFISVRGTELLANWLTDVDFIPRQLGQRWHCPGCKVMTGIFNEWMGVEKQVVEALAEIGCDAGSNTSIVITGHSFGGAVGTLAAYALKMRYQMDVSMLFSFEPPRVGNPAFVDAFAQKVGSEIPVFRITHGRDPVPHLPLEAMGFQHIDVEVFYDEEGSYTICEQTEDPHCANQYDIYNVDDHCSSPLVPSGDICSCSGWKPLLTV